MEYQEALTRSGSPVSLAGETLTSSDNITWTLANLSSQTAAAGTYTLTLASAGSGITDAAGNARAASDSDTWTMDTNAPVASIVDVTPNPRNPP
jgi:hypothetical protein